MSDNHNIPGSQSVGRDLAVGGKVSVRGRMVVEHGLRVKGWLDAPNVKSACRGWLASEDELLDNYPKPQPGWYAYVGAELVTAKIWRATESGWEETGSTYDGAPPLDLQPVVEDMDEISTSLGNIQNSLAYMSGALESKVDNSQLVTLAEAEYDALSEKDANKYYFVYE